MGYVTRDAALEKAFREGSTLLTYLKMDPRFAPIRASYKSPIRKCPGVMHLGPPPMSRAGALVDRVLSTGHPVGVVV